MVGAGGPPALRPRETGRHGERDLGEGDSLLLGPFQWGRSPSTAKSALLLGLPGEARLPPEVSSTPQEASLRGSLFLLHLVSGLFQGNGREEVVACAWDGQTYIIDHNRTVVRFQVDENIRAFCAGGTPPHAQHPCPLAPVTWGEGSSPERSCPCSLGLPLRQELGKHLLGRCPAWASLGAWKGPDILPCYLLC